jgi:hypothetical protein
VAGKPTILITLLVALATPATAGAAGLRTTPVIPPLQGRSAEMAREIYTAGLEAGNSPDVFAKVGDSITESSSFLQELACGPPAWGRWSALEATRNYYGLHTFPPSFTSVWCERANSFSRASATAVSGWDAADAITAPMDDPRPGCRGLAPLECEFALVNPSVALIMYGTNDVESFTPEAYEDNLSALVVRSATAGVVPVLSTIPPRTDSRERNRRVIAFNRVVLRVAHSFHVPVWNYWRSLQGERMVNHGMGEDGVHPNLYGGCEEPRGCRPLDFTRRGLRYGYNQRNLGALRVLDRLRAVLGESDGL